MPYLPLPLSRRNQCLSAFLPPAHASILRTSLISPLKPTSVVRLSVFYSQHQINLTPPQICSSLVSLLLPTFHSRNSTCCEPSLPFVMKGGVLLPSTGLRENCRWELSCAFQGSLSKGFLIQFINQNKRWHDNCRLEQHLSIGKSDLSPRMTVPPEPPGPGLGHVVHNLLSLKTTLSTDHWDQLPYVKFLAVPYVIRRIDILNID